MSDRRGFPASKSRPISNTQGLKQDQAEGFMVVTDQRDRDRAYSYSCSFCGRLRDEVDYLISGPALLYVCERCVGLFDQILARRRH